MGNPPPNPTVEDYHSDEENSRKVESIKRTSADGVGRKSASTASDSGYSSKTGATANSADSARKRRDRKDGNVAAGSSNVATSRNGTRMDPNREFLSPRAQSRLRTSQRRSEQEQPRQASTQDSQNRQMEDAAYRRPADGDQSRGRDRQQRPKMGPPLSFPIPVPGPIPGPRRPSVHARPQSFHAGEGTTYWNWPYPPRADQVPGYSTSLQVAPSNYPTPRPYPASAVMAPPPLPPYHQPAVPSTVRASRPPMYGSVSESYSARLHASAPRTVVSYPQSTLSSSTPAAPSARLLGPTSSDPYTGPSDIVPSYSTAGSNPFHSERYPQRNRAYSQLPSARPYSVVQDTAIEFVNSATRPLRRASVAGRRPSLSTNGSSNGTWASTYSSSSGGQNVLVEQRTGRRLSYYGRDRQQEIIAQLDRERDQAQEYQDRVRGSSRPRAQTRQSEDDWQPEPVYERRRSRMTESSHNSNQSRVSGRTSISRSTMAPEGSVKMRFDVTQGLDFEFSGNMDGRTLSMRPLSDGLAEMTIGTKSPSKAPSRGGSHSSSVSSPSPTQSRLSPRSTLTSSHRYSESRRSHDDSP